MILYTQINFVLIVGAKQDIVSFILSQIPKAKNIYININSTQTTKIVSDLYVKAPLLPNPVAVVLWFPPDGLPVVKSYCYYSSQYSQSFPFSY